MAGSENVNKIVIRFLNKILDNLTIYRAVLYYLYSIIFLSLILSFFGLLPFSALRLIFSFLFFSASAYLCNKLLATFFKIQTNPESQFITAAILTLVFEPLKITEPQKLLLSFLIVSVAMGSKYILVFRRRHFFNPAALAMVFGAVVLNYSASWWVGDIKLWPLVFFGGLVVLKKINRVKMSLFYLIVYLGGMSLYSLFSQASLSQTINLNQFNILETPILFFAFVMLVEPLTSPMPKKKQFAYASFTALTFLFLSVFFQSINYSLELSLLFGNILSYIIYPNPKMVIRLQQIINHTKDIASFVFEKSLNFEYRAGQYVEFTLPHPKTDSRGIRRYFSLSGSPTENSLTITTRFAQPSSTFKQALRSLAVGGKILFNNLSGEFTLPEKIEQLCVFIAGGIGITPYASMVKYLLEKNEKRPITLLYSARSEGDFIFRDLFIEAKDKIGLKTIYKTDRIDWKTIQSEVPEHKNGLYYISGPIPMVGGFTKMLTENGIKNNRIKHDFFPGYN